MEQTEFTDLIRRHRALLYKVAYAYCRNAEDRNDVVQEIVVQLWRSRGSYDNERRLATWIYRIALNVAISFYRRERKHRDQRQPVDAGLLSVEPVERSEEIELLHACIADLDELNRALVLLYLEGNDHTTIADVLGISVSNVGTKMNRIKKLLRRAFDERASQQRRP